MEIAPLELNIHPIKIEPQLYPRTFVLKLWRKYATFEKQIYTADGRNLSRASLLELYTF